MSEKSEEYLEKIWKELQAQSEKRREITQNCVLLVLSILVFGLALLSLR